MFDPARAVPLEDPSRPCVGDLHLAVGQEEEHARSGDGCGGWLRAGNAGRRGDGRVVDGDAEGHDRDEEHEDHERSHGDVMREQDQCLLA